MFKFLDQLMDRFEQNPAATALAITSIIGAVAKLAMVVIEGRNSRTWAREVNRRVKRSYR